MFSCCLCFVVLLDVYHVVFVLYICCTWLIAAFVLWCYGTYRIIFFICTGYVSGNTTKRRQRLRNDNKRTPEIKILHVRYHRKRKTCIFRYVTELVMLVCVEHNVGFPLDDIEERQYSISLR